VEQQGKHVRVPGLVEYLTDVGGEASVIASLHSGEVGSEPAQEVAATAKIKEEKEEEEDPYTHFKRKCGSPRPVASPQKKIAKPLSRYRGTLQIREVEALVVHAPPPVAPVVAYIPPNAPPVEPAADEASG